MHKIGLFPGAVLYFMINGYILRDTYLVFFNNLMVFVKKGKRTMRHLLWWPAFSAANAFRRTNGNFYLALGSSMGLALLF